MSYKPFEQTAQLQFKNCLNFSKDEQVRGGCRGGRDQFSWDALRNMNYADRIHYLGQTVTIGYLDKGGKWRKRDWYTRVTDDDKNRIYDKMTINEEIKQTQDEDARRMRVAMGLEKVDDKTKTTQPNLTKDEVQELTKKTQYNPFLEETNEDKHQGLGLDRKGVAKPSLKLNTYGQTVLEAYGVQNEYQKPPQQQDDEISQAKKKIKKVKKQDKKEKSDEKKEKKSKKSKKDKKDKKDKKRDRKHNTSTDTDD